jgi:hypothetical protein
VVYTKVKLDGDRVEKLNVEFQPTEFDTLAAAATKKWGKPASQNVPMQNGYGAKFDNTLLTWEREGWTIMMTRYLDAESGSLWIERSKQAPPIAPKDRL